MLLAKIQQVDPDVIVGHRLLSFIVDVLISAFTHRETAHWALLGRVRRSRYCLNSSLLFSNNCFSIPRATSKGDWASKTVLSGRLACDTYVLAKEFIRSQKTYELSELAKTQFDKTRVFHL